MMDCIICGTECVVNESCCDIYYQIHYNSKETKCSRIRSPHLVALTRERAFDFMFNPTKYAKKYGYDIILDYREYKYLPEFELASKLL